MHRDTDRAGLIRNRTRDRLPDPPCRIGREFIAAAIFEFIHRLHQADIALLNQIQELQAAIGVFLGDGDHEAQVCLDHFFLRLTRFFLALLNLVHDAAEFADIKADILANLGHIGAQVFDLIAGAFHQGLPPTARFFGHAIHPCGVKFIAAIGLDEFMAIDTGLIRQFHHGAVDRHDAAVDAVKLVNQRLDTVVVQVQFIHQFHNLAAQFLIGGLIARIKARIFIQRGRDTLVLHFGQIDVIIGDTI